MNASRRFAAASVLCLMWHAAALAGAPAPVPVARGPHLPEHQIANLGDFRFENGAVVKDFKVSYVTYGKLNRARDNAILVMHGWGSDHHEFHWQIGPGKALDPEKYFIVATDSLGNTKLRDDVTTGPTNSGLWMDFPAYSLRDSVNVEHKFLKEYLGLERVLAVCGNSIGAAKAYQFAVSHPTYVRGIVPIVGNAVTSAQAKLLLQGLLDIIALDSGWQGGNYETNPAAGVGIAFRMSGLLDFTYAWFAANAKTTEARWQFTQSVRDYWGGQDARDIYYQWRAFRDFSVGDTPGFGGDVEAALRSIKAKVLIVGNKRDQLISRDDLVAHARVIPGARLVEVDSPAGHAVCCGLDLEASKIIDREIASFLSTLR